MIPKDLTLNLDQECFKKTLSFYRLSANPEEVVALQFLYKHSMGNLSLRDLIIQAILNKGGYNAYGEKVTKDEKHWGVAIEENYELVERVVDTLFQWFGTVVGVSTMRQFQETIDMVYQCKKIPFEELPLKIHDKDPFIAQLSQWRLETGSP
jgi:hypothetical protein